MIFTEACGYIAGTPVPNIVRTSHSGTYTATTSGYVTLEIENFRGGDFTTDIKNFIDNIDVRQQNPTFTISNPEISAQTGGTFNFQVNVGPAYANKWMIVIQGVTGTYPGFNMAMGSIHVALNMDFWTDIALGFNPYWPGFFGPLDGNGQKTPSMSTFGPLPPSAVGLALYLDTLILQSAAGTVLGATNSVSVLFIP
ncbi:MAG: hypothetical protein ABIK28_09870 [Planctomycetota bacterium]